MTRTAMEDRFQGPHNTGPRVVVIFTEDSDGNLTDHREFASADKAQSLAIAAREGATIVV